MCTSRAVVCGLRTKQKIIPRTTSLYIGIRQVVVVVQIISPILCTRTTRVRRTILRFPVYYVVQKSDDKLSRGPVFIVVIAIIIVQSDGEPADKSFDGLRFVRRLVRSPIVKTTTCFRSFVCLSGGKGR